MGAKRGLGVPGEKSNLLRPGQKFFYDIPLGKQTVFFGWKNLSVLPPASHPLAWGWSNSTNTTVHAVEAGEAHKASKRIPSLSSLLDNNIQTTCHHSYLNSWNPEEGLHSSHSFVWQFSRCSLWLCKFTAGAQKSSVLVTVWCCFWVCTLHAFPIAEVKWQCFLSYTCPMEANAMCGSTSSWTSHAHKLFHFFVLL